MADTVTKQDRIDRARGALVGLAVGDALGTTLEFGPRIEIGKFHTEMTGGGVFKLAPGQWTDDTAMAVAMGHALLSNGCTFDGKLILSEWQAWAKHGAHSCTGTCFDIGISTSRALKNPHKISKEAKGNGSLMRLVPVVLCASSKEHAIELAGKQSELTHSTDVTPIARLFGGMLYDALDGNFSTDSIAEIRLKERNAVSSDGFYLNTFEAALWAVARTDNFESALIEAINLGHDADSVGAVTGQLAGALYGFMSIPDGWLEPLAWREKLVAMADALLFKP